MCGLAGIFGKTPSERQRLGGDIASMMLRLAHRGPDGAGFAFYEGADAGQPARTRISLLADQHKVAWPALVEALAGDLGEARLLSQNDVEAVIAVDAEPAETSTWLDGAAAAADLSVLSVGRTIETFKCIGSPRQMIETSGLRSRSGTHAVAHTRMATESRVSVNHSHPFCPSPDLALVHNGSLSNHHAVRRHLAGHGVRFQTENDSEVAARFIAAQIDAGATLEQALLEALAALDGFYTFVVATADGFGVLRDRIACKPAILAETEDWVAVASEQAALEVLPGSENAMYREAEPGRVYYWSMDPVPA